MADRSVLVTGGAGYIGSHAVLALLDAGQSVVVLDDLSSGSRDAVASNVPLVVGDVADGALVRSTIREHAVDAVMHFAGSIAVSESVIDPLKYYRNNTCASQALVTACAEAGVSRFIFSSTAAVYGAAECQPVTEDSDVRPESPYGTSKLITEWMLRDLAVAKSDFRYVVLRYFNVAGADPAGRTGQRTPNATHLIKVACEAALGLRDQVDVFGTDYDTPDGSGVRDYIHVSDLASIHLLALNYLDGDGASMVLNCGYGYGFSVRQVLSAVQREAGRNFPIRNAPRRAGDIPSLVADATRIRDVFGWRPRHANLDDIVKHSLAWERKWRG